jgi:hypothetical protein
VKEITLNDLITNLSVFSPERKIDILAVDLHDIYESCNNLQTLCLDVINSQKDHKDKERIVEKLIEIEIELDHINWHSKSLKKELKKILNENK